VSAFRLPRIPRTTPIVDATGKVMQTFQQWWQSVVEKIEAQETSQDQVIADLTAAQADIVTTQTDLAATQADLAVAVADIAAAQAAITGITTDLTGYVLKDQAAAPAYSAYAGQTVSNPPTQAEVQSLDDAVTALATAFVSLKTALQTADVLT
jgi:septal ring factor EnvC (AmiA/AmiB activator)